MRKEIISLGLAVTFVVMSHAQDIGGTWQGMLSAGGQKLEIVFHFDKSEVGGNVVTMDVPAQSAMGIPVNLNFLSADSVSLEVPAIQIIYAGKLSGGKIVGNFKQFGVSFPLDLESGDVMKPNRPQEPGNLVEYKTEEVSFPNSEANVSLAGTLTYPVGYTSDKKGPVVIMVTGSGAQNRDEEVFGHKPFLVIADCLAKQGIASLRYDDRGVGKSTGSQDGCTSADFAEDAACGVSWLKESGKFDKVGIIGHSEGGLIAFMLAADGKADFIVSMAGPGIKGDTLLAEQQNAILALRGFQSRVDVKTLRESLTAQPKNAWMEYFIDYDPKYDLERITIPVMAINGSNDMQVISDSNIGTIKLYLSGKNKKNLIKEYPGLNHLFQHCEPETSLDYYDIEETCSPEVIKDIADWINSL